MILAFLYLILVSLGLGFSAWKLLGLKDEDPFISVSMFIATGLVMFVQASVILGFLYISNWISYLVLTILLLAITAYKVPGAFSFLKQFQLPKISRAWILVLVIFIAHFVIFWFGAFSYPWLEDDDPWQHAAAVKFVSIYNTYIQPATLQLHYLAPYPPFFDTLLGSLYQIDGASLISLLKSVNVLLLSLAIPFFFCFAKRRFNERTALWASFFLAFIPAFMSHFVWAQTLCVLLMFPALYLLDRALENDTLNRNFAFLAILACAAVLIMEPAASAMFFGVLCCYVLAKGVAKSLEEKKLSLESMKLPAMVFLLAFILALCEFWVPVFIVYPASAVLSKLSLSTQILTGGSTLDTGGGLVYSISDIMIAPLGSKIDQATGIGLVVSLLAILAVLLALKDKFADYVAKNKFPIIFALIWLVFGIVGIEANALPIKLVPARFWVILSIPVAILAALGSIWIIDFFDKNKKNLTFVVIAIIFLGTLYTSAYPQYATQTATWPPGVSIVSQGQINGYLGLQSSLPAGSYVFSMCSNDAFAVAMDMNGYPWLQAVNDYKLISVTDSDDNTYAFLKEYNYTYLFFDDSCVPDTTNSTRIAQVQAKINMMSNDSRFTLETSQSSNDFIVFKVN